MLHASHARLAFSASLAVIHTKSTLRWMTAWNIANIHNKVKMNLVKMGKNMLSIFWVWSYWNFLNDINVRYTVENNSIKESLIRWF